MARFITAPRAGDDSRELWRKVEECIDALTALENMTVSVEGRIRMIGQLDVYQTSSILRLQEPSETGSLGA